MSETKPRVAYIVVGWNNRELLKDCFESINQQTYDNKVTLFVDNNSTDGSADWVRRNHPDIKIVALDVNSGFARGNNLGVAAAMEDPSVKYVTLLNTDARLDRGWTETVVGFASMKPNGACYQGTTLDYYNHRVIDSTHIFTARNGQGTQGNWRNYLVHELGPRKVFGVNAAAALISRSFIESQPFGQELLDETMYMYLEDVDLAARATAMGWDNYLVAGALAYHMGSVSSKNKSSTFSLYMTFRNNSAMLYKNFPWKMLVRMSPKILRGDIDTILTLWRTKRRAYIWAVVRGRTAGILRLPLFVSKRRRMTHVREVNSEYLWQLMREGY